MGVSTKRQEYLKEYRRENIRYKSIGFNLKNDEDQKLLKWIESREGKTTPYIKALIRRDIRRMERRTENLPQSLEQADKKPEMH